MVMKTEKKKAPAKPRQKAKTPQEQPKPFTPGITKGMVRQHAFELYRDKLPNEPLTLEDWVLAEKDLVQTMQTNGLLQL
jgi:hypothetical protein